MKAVDRKPQPKAMCLSTKAVRKEEIDFIPETPEGANLAVLP